MWPKKIKAMTLRCGCDAGAHGRESSLNRGKLPDAFAVLSFTTNIIYPEVLKNANLKKKKRNKPRSGNFAPWAPPTLFLF